MEENISRLFKGIPETARVLDIGAWGLEGENTSLDIIHAFKDITNVTKSDDVYNRMRSTYTEQKWIKGWWPMKGLGPFDLIVSDVGIDTNLTEWGKEGLKNIYDSLSENGVYITYVMCTDDYGDPETPAQIRKHWQEWWGGEISQKLVFQKLEKVEGFLLKEVLSEARRPYILWVKLEKTTGSLGLKEEKLVTTPPKKKEAPLKKKASKK